MIKISNNDESNNKVDYNKWTVKELKEFCSNHNIKIPSKAKKKDIVKLIEDVVSHPEFVDRSKDNELDEEIKEEIIAGFDESEEPEQLKKDQLELKFWQKPPYSSLLDFELAKESDIAFYDLASLVDKFFTKMLSENYINYKVSGIALKSASSLHHYKITSIIKEEEQIQKKEELEKLRARHSKTIPKALPQPLSPKMQISTKEDLFEAMRAAIIETMQNKEKLKRRRLRREIEKEKKLQMKSKARLPKELLKHISGKEQTIEELHQNWLNRIKTTANLNSKEEISVYELIEIIKNEEKSGLGRKFALVRMFLALMFLSTGGASGISKTVTEINLSQDEDFKDILIKLKQ